MILKLCPLIEYYIRDLFMEISCRKSTSKSSPRPFLYFGNNPKKPLHARNSFKNKTFWKKIIKNSLKS